MTLSPRLRRGADTAACVLVVLLGGCAEVQARADAEVANVCTGLLSVAKTALDTQMVFNRTVSLRPRSSQSTTISGAECAGIVGRRASQPVERPR